MLNLKALRESLKLKQGDFAAQFGIPQTTYSGYELGQRDPKTQFWIDVADAYKVSTDYLLGQTDDPHGTKYQALSPLETRYRALDPHSRKVVDAVMELEAERFAREIITPEKPKTRVIPLFIAAAGPGEPVNGIFEEHEIPYEKKGEFAVKVSGDSMEPELKDGEIVLCMKRPPKNGELGVIMVNGSLLVKQVITAGGDIYLRSLNRARKNLDVDLFESGNDTVACYGTVIHKHVPLVIQ